MVITNKKQGIINAAIAILALAVIYEIIRDSLRLSYFARYVRAGNAFLSGDFISASRYFVLKTICM